MVQTRNWQIKSNNPPYALDDHMPHGEAPSAPTAPWAINPANMHRDSYTPLSQVAFPDGASYLRGLTDLHHPAPPTSHQFPRATQSWNPGYNSPKRSIQNFRGISTIFAGPRVNSPGIINGS